MKTSDIAQARPDNQMRWGSHRHMLLKAYGRSKEGLTDEQAGMTTGLFQRRSVYWARCSELRRMGLIRPTNETRQTEAEQLAAVCVITTKGTQRLAQMEVAKKKGGR